MPPRNDDNNKKVVGQGKKTVGDILREIEEKKGYKITNNNNYVMQGNTISRIKKNNKPIPQKQYLTMLDKKGKLKVIAILLLTMLSYFFYRGVSP